MVREMGQPQAKRGGAGGVDRTKSNISTIKRISNFFHSDKNFVHKTKPTPRVYKGVGGKTWGGLKGDP